MQKLHGDGAPSPVQDRPLEPCAGEQSTAEVGPYELRPFETGDPQVRPAKVGLPKIRSPQNRPPKIGSDKPGSSQVRLLR